MALLARGVAACSSSGTPTDGLAPEAGVAGLETLAGEELRDTGPPGVPLPQVEAGPREQVPSALREPQADGLPQPSVDLSDIVSGGQPPDGIPALDAPRFQRTVADRAPGGVEVQHQRRSPQLGAVDLLAVERGRAEREHLRLAVVRHR